MALLTGCIMYLIFDIAIFYIGVVHAVYNQVGMPSSLLTHHMSVLAWQVRK